MNIIICLFRAFYKILFISLQYDYSFLILTTFLVSSCISHVPGQAEATWGPSAITLRHFFKKTYENLNITGFEPTPLGNRSSALTNYAIRSHRATWNLLYAWYNLFL